MYQQRSQQTMMLNIVEFEFARYERHRMRALAVRRPERPYCRQTCFVSEVFRNVRGIARAAPSSCFLWQCNSAWATGKVSSVREETIAAFGSKPVACLANGPRNSDRDKRQCRTSAMTWRATKGLLEVMTGRTWPEPGLSHKAGNTREYIVLRF